MYVIVALRSVAPGIGEAFLAMLRAPGVNLAAEALPALINELADISERLVLVLDDYHTIEEELDPRRHGFARRAFADHAAHRDDVAC